MEPNNPSPMEKLPAPQPRGPEQTPAEPVESAPSNQEKLAPPTESASQGAPPPLQTAPVAPLPDPAKIESGESKPTSTSHSTGPAIADDVDVIEKEWVNKAKSIVADTKHDPYRQEEEVSKLQADYLKKRYDKDIKLAA